MVACDMPLASVVGPVPIRIENLMTSALCVVMCSPNAQRSSSPSLALGDGNHGRITTVDAISSDEMFPRLRILPVRDLGLL
jgi:hypothetical protein